MKSNKKFVKNISNITIHKEQFDVYHRLWAGFGSGGE